MGNFSFSLVFIMCGCVSVVGVYFCMYVRSFRCEVAVRDSWLCVKSNQIATSNLDIIETDPLDEISFCNEKN